MSTSYVYVLFLAALWYIVMMIQVTSNSLLSKESKRQLCFFSSQIYLIFFCYLINRLCANFQTLNSSYFIFRAVFKSVRGRRGCEYLFSKLFLTLRKNSIMLGLNFILLYNIETAKRVTAQQRTWIIVWSKFDWMGV